MTQAFLNKFPRMGRIGPVMFAPIDHSWSAQYTSVHNIACRQYLNISNISTTAESLREASTYLTYETKKNHCIVFLGKHSATLLCEAFIHKIRTIWSLFV